MKMRNARLVCLWLASISYSSAVVAQGVGFDTQQRPPFEDICAWSNRLEDPARDMITQPGLQDAIAAGAVSLPAALAA